MWGGHINKVNILHMKRGGQKCRRRITSYTPGPGTHAGSPETREMSNQSRWGVEEGGRTTARNIEKEKKVKKAYH